MLFGELLRVCVPNKVAGLLETFWAKLAAVLKLGFKLQCALILDLADAISLCSRLDQDLLRDRGIITRVALSQLGRLFL